MINVKTSLAILEINNVKLYSGDTLTDIKGGEFLAPTVEDGILKYTRSATAVPDFPVVVFEQDSSAATQMTNSASAIKSSSFEFETDVFIPEGTYTETDGSTTETITYDVNTELVLAVGKINGTSRIFPVPAGTAATQDGTNAVTAVGSAKIGYVVSKDSAANTITVRVKL